MKHIDVYQVNFEIFMYADRAEKVYQDQHESCLWA